MKKIIPIILVIIFLGVAGFAAYKVLFITNDYKQAVDEYAEVANNVKPQEEIQINEIIKIIDENTTSIDPETGEFILPEVFLPGHEMHIENLDWDKLLSINRDTIAYIIQHDTLIDYPIVQGTDNAYYLNHTIMHKEVSSGTLFADYHNKNPYNQALTIVYGHNMTNQTMFGSLRNYIYDKEYFSNHEYMMLYTPDHVYLLEIFAFGQPSAFDAKIYDTTRDLTAIDYYNRLKSYKYVKKEITVSENDRFMLMSTCTPHGGENRTVIIGRLIPLD